MPLINNIRRQQRKRKRPFIAVFVVTASLLVGVWICILYISYGSKTPVPVNTTQQNELLGVNRGQQIRNNNSLDEYMNGTASYMALPVWMQEYVVWHRKQVQSLTAENWKSHRFLIARCLDIDRACGGLSDRLNSLPVLMLIASQSNRILLIYWNRPAPLEEFLLPNILNWTRPQYIPVHGPGTKLYTKLNTLVKATTDKNITVPVLCTRLQSQHGGSEYYNAHILNIHEERAFRKVFRSLFFTLFTPAPSIQEQVVRDLQGLKPNLYVGAHFRANYGASPFIGQMLQSAAINTVNGASQLVFPIGTSTGDVERLLSPILFLSDSQAATQHVHSYASTHNYSIITMIHRNNSSLASEPLHLDKANSVNANEYHDIFVDLLLMANAKCMVHGLGGFGRLGVLLSHDPMCFLQTVENAHIVEYTWKASSIIL